MLEAARAQAGRGRRRRRRRRRDARPRRDGARWPKGLDDPAPPPRRVSRHHARGVRPRRRARPPARAPPGGRAGPHQRARARATPSAGRTSRSCSTPASTSTTTLNVQHVESLNDVVAQITGVTGARDGARLACSTRPTRSSWSTSRPTICSQRLREGKVYVPEQAAPRASSSSSARAT